MTGLHGSSHHPALTAEAIDDRFEFMKAIVKPAKKKILVALLGMCMAVSSYSTASASTASQPTQGPATSATPNSIVIGVGLPYYCYYWYGFFYCYYFYAGFYSYCYYC